MTYTVSVMTLSCARSWAFCILPKTRCDRLTPPGPQNLALLGSIRAFATQGVCSPIMVILDPLFELRCVTVDLDISRPKILLYSLNTSKEVGIELFLWLDLMGGFGTPAHCCPMAQWPVFLHFMHWVPRVGQSFLERNVGLPHHLQVFILFWFVELFPWRSVFRGWRWLFWGCCWGRPWLWEYFCLLLFW